MTALALSAFPVFSQSVKSGKNLVVYFPRAGNTEILANHIYELVGGDRVELEPSESYPANYNDTLSRIRTDLDQGAGPPLRTRINNMAQYDTIFFGLSYLGRYHLHADFHFP